MGYSYNTCFNTLVSKFYHVFFSGFYLDFGFFSSSTCAKDLIGKPCRSQVLILYLFIQMALSYPSILPLHVLPTMASLIVDTGLCLGSLCLDSNLEILYSY